jgi:hypothetical protein
MRKHFSQQVTFELQQVRYPKSDEQVAQQLPPL